MRIKKAFFSFAYILILAGGYLAFAQGRIIDESTYNAQLRKASEFLFSSPYRTRQVTERCNTDECVWSPLSLVVTEVFPPARRHSWTTNTDRGEKEPSNEWIFIGDKIYVNRKNTGWRVEAQSESKVVDQKTEVLSVEYQDLGRSTIDGKETVLLLRTTRTRIAVQNETIENVATVRSWISNRLVLQEFLSTNSKSGTTRITISYEPDPSITIKEPIHQ